MMELRQFDRRQYAVRLGLLALASAVPIGLALATLSGITHQRLTAESLMWCVVGGSCIWLSCWAFLHLIHVAEAGQISGSLLFAGLVLGQIISSSVLLFHKFNFLSDNQFYLSYVLGNLLIAGSVGALSAFLMQLRGAIVFQGFIAGVATFAVFSTGLWWSRDWIDFSMIPYFIRMEQAGFVITVFCAFITVALVLDREALPTVSLMVRVRSRFFSHRSGRLEAISGLALLVTQLAGLCIVEFSRRHSKSAFISIFALVFDWSVLAAFYYSFGNYLLYEKSQAISRFALSVLPPAARRFFGKHNQSRSYFAEVRGHKMPLYTVDHDPSGKIEVYLPSSFMQIRAVDISRRMKELIDEKSFNQISFGSVMTGGIDGAHSIHPCVDAVITFACLHLDIIGAANNRIEQLLTLLPILDADFDEKLDLHNISVQLNKNNSIFYLDYDWFDQELVRTPRSLSFSTNYKLNVESVKLIRSLQLTRTDILDNGIWLHQRAADRIKFEAPQIGGLLQGVNAMTPGPMSTHEVKLYFVGFRDLVPVLEAFFCLEGFRKNSKSFSESRKAMDFLTVMQLQIREVQSSRQLLGMLGSIASYPWRGFLEKDRALAVLKELFVHVTRVVKESSTKLVNTKDSIEPLRRQFISAAVSIGYPSQMLHAAQVKKFTNRKLDKLLFAASLPGSTGFDESWIYMTEVDVSRFQPADLERVIKLFGNIRQIMGNLTDELFCSRVIDAVANLGCRLPEDKLRAVLSQLGLAILTKGNRIELLNRLMDACEYLEREHNMSQLFSVDLVGGIRSFLLRLDDAKINDLGLSLEHKGLVCRFQRYAHAEVAWDDLQKVS